MNETKRVDQAIMELQSYELDEHQQEYLQEIISYNEKLIEIENTAIELVKKKTARMPVGCYSARNIQRITKEFMSLQMR